MLLHQLSTHIAQVDAHALLPRMKITFNTGLILYIRYNDHGEYSYQLIFSSKKNDFIRYDNYDDLWMVISRPHHCHNRGKISSSPMIGDPATDIPLLVKEILTYL